MSIENRSGKVKTVEQAVQILKELVAGHDKSFGKSLKTY